MDGIRAAIGNSLPGAKGATVADQNKIDDTVARGCATDIYKKSECKRHTEASTERRKEL